MLGIVLGIYLWIGTTLKWLASHTPDLIQQAAIAPDVAGSGVFAVVCCLGGCPLYWNFTTLGHIVIIVHQVPGHAKVCNL